MQEDMKKTKVRLTDTPSEEREESTQLQKAQRLTSRNSIVSAPNTQARLTLSDLIKLRTEPMYSVSKDVWNYHIFSRLDIPSIKSFSETCKHYNRLARPWIREHHHRMSNRTSYFDMPQLWISPSGVFTYDKIDLDAIDRRGLPTIDAMPLFPTVRTFVLPTRKYPEFRSYKPGLGPDRTLPREILPLRLLQYMPNLIRMQLPIILLDDSISPQASSFDGFEFTRISAFSETQFYVCDKGNLIYLLDSENSTITKQAELEAHRRINYMKVTNSFLFIMDTYGITQWRIEKDTHTLKRLHTFKPCDGFIGASGNFELLQNETRLVMIQNSTKKCIHIFDIESGKHLKEIEIPDLNIHLVRKIDELSVLLLTREGIIYYYNLTENTGIRKLDKFSYPSDRCGLRPLNLLCDSNEMLMYDNIGMISAFDYPSLIKRIPYPTRQLAALSNQDYLDDETKHHPKRLCNRPLDSTREYFITCRGDNIRLFNRKTKSCIGLLATDSTMYHQCIAITPGGRIIHIESTSPPQASHSKIRIYQPVCELLRECKYDFSHFSLSEATLRVSKSCIVNVSSPAFYDIELNFSPQQEKLFIKFIDHFMRATITGYEGNSGKVERYTLDNSSIKIKSIQSEYLEEYIRFFQYFWQRFGNESDLIIVGSPDTEPKNSCTIS